MKSVSRNLGTSLVKKSVLRDDDADAAHAAGGAK
jgi:hypothetical protein